MGLYLHRGEGGEGGGGGELYMSFDEKVLRLNFWTPLMLRQSLRIMQ